MVLNSQATGGDADSEPNAACVWTPRVVNAANTLAPSTMPCAGVAAAAFVIDGGALSAGTCTAPLAEVAYPFIAATSWAHISTY
ncbi:hypothetical protein MHEI_46690 [Mycobacterium heidelbergense]|nr:hypothetical protein MHEI_46690 [Mycobacterium heidelbergense]